VGFPQPARADYCGKSSIDPRPFGSTIRGLAAHNVGINKGGRGERIKASISLQDLRRRLYIKAKAEPAWRFWGLYVHVCKRETLREAYRLAKANKGAPGIDGVTFAAVEAEGTEQFLDQLHEELVQRTYRPQQTRKVEIPKGGGKTRQLSILKVDSQAVPVRADGPKALPKDTEFAASPGRHLNGRQSNALGIQLKQFASKKFWIIAETGIYAPESEQMRFAEQLRSALLAAGWMESQFILQRMGTAGFKKTKMAPFSHGGDSGVVVFADKASMPAGTRLWNPTTR
jgi:hypothetical protein